MRRVKIRREVQLNPLEEENERLQLEVAELKNELDMMRKAAAGFALEIRLTCNSGNASFTGEVALTDLQGKTATTPVDGYFKSTNRRESRRDFSIPVMFFGMGTGYPKFTLGGATSPNWQKHAEQQLERKKTPEHILAMRRRIR
jgi:hypothetical protein